MAEGGELVGNLERKREKVAEIKEKLQKATVAVFTDYRGLNVPELNELRNQLRENGAEYKVVKNTFTRRAVKEIGLEELEQYLEGPTAVAFGYEDAAAPAKTLLKFSKENEAFSIKVGILEGKIIDVKRVKSLGELPSREVLLGQVCGAFQAPIAGFVNVLQGNIRSLVYALQAVQEKLESETA
ncbi:MAG: 50S ribosomal protein L10 [Dethiobacteria bacterium]